MAFVVQSKLKADTKKYPRFDLRGVEDGWGMTAIFRNTIQSHIRFISK